MYVKFYCKELGTFSLNTVATYHRYKDVYPDMIRIDGNGSPIMFDDECIELLLAK